MKLTSHLIELRQGQDQVGESSTRSNQPASECSKDNADRTKSH